MRLPMAHSGTWWTLIMANSWSTTSSMRLSRECSWVPSAVDRFAYEHF
jgi:hypothetical protein